MLGVGRLIGLLEEGVTAGLRRLEAATPCRPAFSSIPIGSVVNLLSCIEAQAARLTEALLFGCIAQRFPGKELAWDNDKHVFSNSPEATVLLQGFKREGFEPKV